MTNNFKPLRIAGVGYSVPNTVVTNDDLTKLYDTSDEWIYTRTGIKERRLVSGDETAIDLGIEAAKRALDKSGIKPEDIDLVIAASSAPPVLAGELFTLHHLGSVGDLGSILWSGIEPTSPALQADSLLLRYQEACLLQ